MTNVLKNLIPLLVYRYFQFIIHAENKFVFANSMKEGRYCIRKECIKKMVEEPSRITSTNLRKYVATVVQLINLQEVHIDMLARHFGHNIQK